MPQATHAHTHAPLPLVLLQVDIPLLLADYKRVVKLTEKVKGFLTDQVEIKPMPTSLLLLIWCSLDPLAQQDCSNTQHCVRHCACVLTGATLPVLHILLLH